MIKFFRNIRYKLLGENRFSRYLVYAIGEIVLVVIGILVALQINNWNEDNKVKATELRLLAEVKSNLESTLREFQEDTIYNRQTIRYYRNILDYVNQDLDYDTRLDSAFAAIPLFASPFASTSGYQSLQQRGFGIIQNQELKLEIQNLYDVLLSRLLIDVDKVEWSMQGSTVNPFFVKHIRILNEGSLNQARPNDFESLKQNEEFKNILNQLIRERTKSILYYVNAMRAMEELIDKIEVEINKRS